MRFPSIFAIAAFSLMALGAGPASAQATRTWVSGVGDDVNPCSRTAPCKTFAGAISKTAAAGEINCLDPGGFGAVTITKSISLICDGFTAGVLVSGTNGVVVAAGANDIVTLVGLDMDGLGTGLSGIQFNSGGELHVRNTRIRNFTISGINFTPSAGSELYVEGVSITGTASPTSSQFGIQIKPSGAGASANAHLTNVRLDKNGHGLSVDSTATSVGANVNVQTSRATGNSFNGFQAVSAGPAIATITLTASMASGNVGSGLFASGAGAVVRAGGSTISANATGVSASPPGQVRSFGNNQLVANSVNGAFSGADSLQ